MPQTREQLHATHEQVKALVEDGRLAGIISIGDVVKHRLEEVERESDALREYIATA